MKNVLLVLLLAGITSYTAISTAQNTNSNSISGVVTDSLKHPVASVWVVLSQDNKQVGKSLTGEDGKYYIGSLAQGNYELIVKKGERVYVQKKVLLPKDQSFNIKLSK